MYSSRTLAASWDHYDAAPGDPGVGIQSALAEDAQASAQSVFWTG